MFGSIRILVFPKGSKKLYAYIIEILCQMLSGDLMLGVHVYLYSPKIRKNSVSVML
jgi:hypothetical protein